MYHLSQFSLKAMTECGAALRKLGHEAESMEDAAAQIVHFLYDQFRNAETGDRSFAMVRLFKTHNFGELTDDLQQFVQSMLGDDPASDQMKCLTLMSTVGDRPEWCSRAYSQGHQSIPLVSEHMVEQIPMISRLIHQFGLDLSSVLAPTPDLIMDLRQRTFNVFHVPEALGNPYVPAQAEFVAPVGVQSVLGFGGMLPSGNLMAIILFSKDPISRETADLFKTLALNTKMALLPFDRGRVFAAA